jgi:5-hydroxyisourate hydrolase
MEIAAAPGCLTFHGIDTFHGETRAPLTVDVAKVEGGGLRSLLSFRTVANGRSDGAVVEGAAFETGFYELLVHVGDYYAGLGIALPMPPFVTEVPLRFGIANPRERHHIAFLFGPWSYAYYRGS